MAKIKLIITYRDYDPQAQVTFLSGAGGELGKTFVRQEIICKNHDEAGKIKKDIQERYAGSNLEIIEEIMD